MAAQRQSNARPVHTKTTETCQSPKPINPSRQNSIVVPVAVDDLTYLDPCDEEAKKELNREAERRTLFQNVSNGILEIPNGYRKVEVLIIRWDESVDEFKDHKQEIDRLETIFTTGFGFGCTVKSIRNSRNPQIDLNHHILTHVHEHDGEDNLLIVYYTGHGVQIEDEKGSCRLQLSATRSWDENSGHAYAPTAFWDEAEAPLKLHAAADTLAILDCCSASTAAVNSKGRNEELRNYQLLAASSAAENTRGPGQESFTHALCESLRELLMEAKGGTFPVIKLWERINTKRTTQAALMWDRLQRYKRNVELGRLDPNPERDASFRNEEPEKASLVLRFSLKEETLDNLQVEVLARQLPAVFKEAGVLVRRMEYVELERRDDAAKAFRTEPGRRYDAAKAFRKVVHQIQESVLSDKISYGEHGRQSAIPESRKRKSSYADRLLTTKRSTRDSSCTSEETAESGLCTPPKRVTKPGSEVDGR